MLLSTNRILTVGRDLASDDNTLGTYGGNPVQKIDPTAQTHSAGPDPNSPTRTVGAWHYNNVVLMHTLKSDWMWDVGNPLLEYDLDRVFALEGVDQSIKNGAETFDILEHVMEYQRGPPETWFRKADSPLERIWSNAVILPDGTILVVGGQDEKVAQGDDNTVYYFRADRFDPGFPTATGTWTTLNPTVTVSQTGEARHPYSTPRGYHSTALLLANGTVVLMGGVRDGNDALPIPRYPSADPEDTIEIFKPPYLFSPGRPSITAINGVPPVGGTPNPIQYGAQFSLTVSKLATRQIQSVCLIGVGAATHHFSYGQRYVELMFQTITDTGTQATLNVMAPPGLAVAPSTALAPEGMYMLFVVDNGPQFGLPSVGKFVKVSF